MATGFGDGAHRLLTGELQIKEKRGVMEEGGGGLAAMGWRTEEAGVSRLVKRAFSRPQSMNGETEGGGELRGNNVSI